MRKDEYIKFLSIFLIVIFLILFIEYLLFKIVGFNEENFFFISLVIFVLSLIFGIFLAKYSFSYLIQTNELLDRLLKDTLHELNIPVATILANIRLLSKNEKDEKKLKRLDRIKKAANQLLDLYNDMDYYIKKQIQKVNYDIFNLKELIMDRLAFIEDIKKDIKIYTDLEDIYVKTDKKGFSKTVDNLLSNAIKYNRAQGYIKIVLKEEFLSIEDSGIGMDEGEILKIFERYYQSKDAKEGYGIGLNIVKSFCDENKIYIKIDSKKGVGTKIVLNLKNVLT